MKFALLAALALAMAMPVQAKAPDHHRWNIKTSSTDTPERNVPLGVLLALPNPHHQSHAVLDTKRIEAPVTAFGVTLHEGDNITTSGFLRVAASEEDGDLHLQLSATPQGNEYMIIEVPRSTSAGPLSRADMKAARAYIAKLIGHRPSAKGTVLKDAPLVEATGALFYDVCHENKDGSTQKRGKRGMLVNTLWELHPSRVRSYVPDKLVKEQIAASKI